MDGVGVGAGVDASRAGLDAAGLDAPGLDAVRAAVDALAAGVDALLAEELTWLTGPQVVGLVEAVEVQRRRLAAVDQRLLAELAVRGTAGEYGRASVPDLLVSLLRVSPGEARSRVRDAADMGPRLGMSGETLPRLFPLVAQAQADGDISTAHARVITACIEHLAPDTAHEIAPVAETFLIHAAGHETPHALTRTAALLLARLDPDGLEPDEAHVHRRREFTLLPCSDGSSLARGRLTAETTAVWQTILDSLSAPTPADNTSHGNGGDGDKGAGDKGAGGAGAGGSAGGSAGEVDPRSPGQRRHDALLDAGLRLTRAGTLPDSGGIPTTVLVRTTLTELRTITDTATPDTDITETDMPDTATTGPGSGASGGSGGVGSSGGSGGVGVSCRSDGVGGVAQTAHGALMSLTQLMHLACEADILPVVLNDTGGITAYGRTRRLASRGQRHALAARDGGCSFPDCTRPSAWTEVHHIKPWITGGTTDLDNLCLLCPYHHREFQRRGWSVHVTDGQPRWTPPAWLDPDRRPRQNTAQHLPEIDFATHATHSTQRTEVERPRRGAPVSDVGAFPTPRTS